jgi:hypothetical protein
MISPFKALAITLALGLMTIACTPASQPGSTKEVATSDPNGNPTTGWKEGYGGDSLEIEVLRTLEGICNRARELRPTILNSALEARDSRGETVDVVSGLCAMMQQGALRIQVVEQPMVAGESKDMANFPFEKPKRLEIKRSWWLDQSIQPDKRQALILHELIPLIGLSDIDYVRSTRLLIALSAIESRVTVVSCDEKRIESVLAGAHPELLRTYLGFLGHQLCAPAREILNKYSATSDFGEEMTLAMQHHFLWGTFQKMARGFSHDEINQAARFLNESFDKLPDSVRPLSLETCNEIGEVRPSEVSCGTFLDVVVGASPMLKARGGVANTATDLDYFDRAALLLIKLLEARRDHSNSFIGNPLFNSSGEISRPLIARAIEAQNWWIVALFGQIHKKFDLRQVPPHFLLRELNFTEIREKSIVPSLDDRIPDGRIQDIRPCSNGQVRSHATGVINGDRSDPLYCGASAAI